MSVEDIKQIALYLKDKGAEKLVIQAYRPVAVTGGLDNKTVRRSDVLSAAGICLIHLNLVAINS